MYRRFTQRQYQHAVQGIQSLSKYAHLRLSTGLVISLIDLNNQADTAMMKSLRNILPELGEQWKFERAWQVAVDTVKEDLLRGTMRRMFWEAGHRAQLAMLQHYLRHVEGRRRPRSKYEFRDKRYAGRKLWAVISSPHWFYVTRAGISWGNFPLLWAHAPHWRRLEFGAGGRAGAAGAAAISISGREMGQMQARWGRLIVKQFAAQAGGLQPSPPFEIPAGWWVTSTGVLVRPSARREDAFLLGRHVRSFGLTKKRAALEKEARKTTTRTYIQRRRVTRGIMARHFIRFGLSRLIRELVGSTRNVRQEFQQGLLRTFENTLEDRFHDWMMAREAWEQDPTGPMPRRPRSGAVGLGEIRVWYESRRSN